MKIQFDPDEWAARTAGLPRIASSILFDVSLHNWRTGTSMSLAHLRAITMDMPEDQAMGIADMLHAAKMIHQDDNGVWSPDAIAQWRKAEDKRAAQADGGRRGRAQAAASALPTPQAPSLPDVSPVEPPRPAQPPAPPHDDAIEDDPIARAIKAGAQAKADREAMAINVAALAGEWNIMASKSGLPQIKAMSDKRRKAAAARIRDHGIDAMLAAINSVPSSDFLMGRRGNGWKGSFDFLLQESSCLKLLEGTYHQQGEGTGSAWR